MKKLIYISLIFVMFASCEKPEQLGPDIVGIYGPLNVTEAFDKSTAAPNFATGGSVYFTAKFENDAIWTITIIGQTSGATKTITGVSKEINASNSIWNGTANDAPSFRAENVIATLSFSNSTSTFTQNLTIAGTKNLDAGGVIVSNFAVSKVSNGNHTTTTLWRSDWNTTLTTNPNYVKPDGNNYLFMSGNPWEHSIPGDTNSNVTPYIDYLRIFAQGADVNYGTYFPLYADPTKVYFNIMVYNTGTTHTWLRVVLIEEGDISRNIDIRPDWIGWKQLSFNYTEFTLEQAGSPFQPNKINSIQFFLFSDATQTVLNQKADLVSTAFDHVIFTHNKPYQP